MKKLTLAVLSALVAAAPIAAASTASAGGYVVHKNHGYVVPQHDYNNNYNHEYNNNGNVWVGAGAGFIAGAAVGALATRPVYPRAPSLPVYYAPPPPRSTSPAPAYYAGSAAYTTGLTEANLEWCIARYRSYNPATNTFVGYDGYAHACVGPY